MNTVAEVKRKARILLMFSVRRTQEKEAAPYIWKIVLYIQRLCYTYNNAVTTTSTSITDCILICLINNQNVPVDWGVKIGVKITYMYMYELQYAD